MHLLDWDGYGKAGAPTAPAFIGETLYKVKADKATDPVRGLRVREAPPSGRVLAILPKGSKVKVGEVHSADPRWRKLVAIVQGRALPALASPVQGWVFIKEMEPTSDADVFLVGEDANDQEPMLVPEKGLNVRKAGNGRAPITGVLPTDAKFRLESATGPYRKLKEIVAGKDAPPLSANSVQNIQGFVHFDSLEATRSEPVLDRVHVLPTPFPVKAGDVIGHLGQYQNHDDGSPQSLLHLEVFSCEDVPAFIARSRAWAAQLPDQQKTLLKVYKGASKLIPHREGINANNPPKTSDAGTAVGFELIIPQSLLDSLPADRKLQVSTTVPGSTTPQVTRWWRLDNLLADSSGNPISGWLAEQEPITTRHNPWEWPGYDFIKETGRPIGKVAYLYDALRRLTDEERANYRALVSQEDQGPVKARLYDIIDSNRDNKLTATEIRAALKKPWHAQSIAQLVTHYESEWFWKADKWDELDPLMGHIPFVDPNPNWESEKERIEKLSWWGSLAGKHGINADGKAWHFQPVGLIATLKINRVNQSIRKGKITFDAEGNNIPGSPFFSRVIHWPGNELSGVTLGRGYDMGSRSESEIYGHMIEAGIGQEQATKIAQAHGLNGSSAQQFVANNKLEIGEISSEQEIALFNLIYPDYVDRAIQNYNHWTIGEAGRFEWSNLDQVIQDILVDFVYQGFTKGPNPMKAGMKNDKNELINYIENTPAISQYEPGRRRANYLGNN
ncbi:pesticin C-terminus-like muramidase [Pseudomonas indica]|uniref:pesticin C-terminus-like muramidase n=2 Tax=Pseudomonas indica TaxID=137658 RepID=UPI0023F63B7B|nr:pesticin C-terminus-like muramidase [Pseudomonas indica]